MSTIKEKMELFFAQARTELLAIVIGAGVLIFILFLNIRIGSAPIQGIALAHSIQHSEVGNIPKLSVVLPDGEVAQVTIQSPGMVKPEDSVCLTKSKTIVGSSQYRFKNAGKCT